MASCTGKSVPSKTDTDDLYVKSGDVVLPGAVASARTQAPPALPYDDSYDPVTEGFQGGTDEYFDENYLTSKDLKRKTGAGAGYSDGYADGYSQGWSDNAWTFAGAGRLWNSPYGFNSFYPSFGSGMFFSYSPFIGFGNSWNMGWGSRWGSRWGGWYDPWDPFFGSYAYGWGGSPYFGYNRFYSPWGYNSYYSGWGDPYGYGWGNPYYGHQTVFVNNIYNGRTVRQRNSTLANSRYNDQLVSRTSANNARVAAVDRGSRSAVSRSAGSSARDVNSSARMSSADRSSISRSSGTRSYDAYTRSSSVNSARSSQSAGSRVGSSAGRSGNPSSAGRQSSPTYNRSSGSSTGRSSSPSYNSGGSRSSSPSYNAGSSSRSSGGSSSSSGGSRSSSGGGGGGSSSSGGGSRGRG